MKMMNEVRSKGRLGNRLSWLLPGVLVVAGIVIELGLAQTVYAAVFHIASGDVTGLINALNTANSNGQVNTINLAAGTYTLVTVDNNIDEHNGLPSISGKVTIRGTGPDTTFIERDFNNPAFFRIFHVDATGFLTVDGLTIRGGGGVDPFNPPGAGIFNNGGEVNVNDSTLSGNDGAFGAAIFSIGILTIANSTIIGNVAITGDSGGGAIISEGTLSITDSIIMNNIGVVVGAIESCCTTMILNSTISNNGALRFDGAIDTAGTTTIIDSTIANNGASQCAGITNETSGMLTVINSTIAGNISSLDLAAGFCNGGTLIITNSTIANNSGGLNGGGGISNGGTVELQNTILAHNVSTLGIPDCSGRITSLGNNIIGDATGCSITLQSSDLTGDPGLGTFTDNGTPGNGHFPLLPNSQAINAGNNNVCLSNPILVTDQIGDPRVGICDIGSIEFEPFKNLGQCISTLIKQNCSGLKEQSRAACNHEQQTFCFNLFKSK